MKRLNVTAILLCLTAPLMLAGCGLGTVSASIGGTITGLSSGTTVGLLNNGTDSITVSANGNFSFDTQLQAGAAYNVTVKTQPSGETCTVTAGAGTVDQNTDAVTGITVTCVATTTSNEIFGTVSGLATGKSVTLLATASPTETTTVSGNGAFVFPTAVVVGSTYVVTVANDPVGQSCSVTNGSGTVPAAGTQTDVLITCI